MPEPAHPCNTNGHKNGPKTSKHQEADLPCLRAALDYLRRGWSPLPLEPEGKIPAIPWKPFQDQPATEAQVRGWWNHHPSANVGVALGPVSGMIGLDLDTAAGFQLLRGWAGGEPPDTLAFTTPNGGMRLLYTIAEGEEYRVRSFKDANGKEALRILSKGSQTVMPPSTLTTGSYLWLPGRRPQEITPAPVPAFLRDRLREEEAPHLPPDADAAARARAYLQHCDPAVSGQAGHAQTFKVAVKLVRGFRLSPAEALALLLAEYNQRCVPPWSEKELRHKVTEAAGAEARLPDGWLLDTPRQEKATPTTPPDSTQRFGKFLLPSELPTEPEALAYIWEDYIARRCITLLASLWKAGKTTLLHHLIRHMAHGGTFCDRVVTPGHVIYITEESKYHWAARHHQHIIAPNVHFLCRPFRARPTMTEWHALLDYAAEAQARYNASLLVLDTYCNLWPVEKENDPGEVTSALAPLHQFTAAGAAVLLPGHLRKMPGGEATQVRGSGAIAAFVDIIVEMRRHNATEHSDRARSLTCYSRIADTNETVITLSQDGTTYKALGDRRALDRAQLAARLHNLLPTHEPGIAPDTLHSKWPTNEEKPGLPRLRAALEYTVEQGAAQRTGQGKKGSPYLYWAPA